MHVSWFVYPGYVTSTPHSSGQHAGMRQVEVVRRMGINRLISEIKSFFEYLYYIF